MTFLARLFSSSLQRISFICFVAVCLSACSLSGYRVVESSNQNSRVNYLVLHATSENFAESLRLLTTPTSNSVSSHYLLPSDQDLSYGSSKLAVYELVPESRRAWHAGVSRWGLEESLNDRSIGIEIVNEFKCNEGIGAELSLGLPSIDCEFPPYPANQIELLVELIHSILSRYPEIDPVDVIAHSDIAVTRKSDPGPLFPWHALYQQGIGAWPDSAQVAGYQALFSERLPSVATVQQALAFYGYDVELTGEIDTQTGFAVRAFQLHFRPSNYSGELDAQSVAILWALLEKYRSDVFPRLNH